MGGADFCKFNLCLSTRLTPLGAFLSIPHQGISCRPPRVRTITFISRPPHLLHGVRVALDFPLLCRVVRPYTALYVVSVRRPATLPCRGPFILRNPASFRFHLAMDDPCLLLAVPATEPAVDFHHQVIAHAGRTQPQKSHSKEWLFLLGKTIHGRLIK